MQQHELTRPDAAIRYWIGDPEMAPALVLLHGATLDHACKPQVDAMRSRHRVVVPDLRAHGVSTGPGQSTSETRSATAWH
jgi:pimeloyl-ACP methyl ester carboxylesterase